MIDAARQSRRPPITMLTSLLALLALHSIACGKQEHNSAPIELSGFSISEAYEIPDDRPLDLQSPILKQLLYRIKNTSPKSRRQYSRFTEELSWQDATAKTEDYRLWVFDLPARLRRIEKHRFQNFSNDEEVQGVYVCHCETVPEDGQPDSDTRGQPFLTLSRTMPRELPVDMSIDEPIRVEGFLYARISGTERGDNNEMLVFITDRIAWHPSAPSKFASAAHVTLSRQGVDIGLLDQLRENNTRPLGGRDAEAFFQMLAAVNRMTGDEAIADSGGEPESGRKTLGFNELMQNADANFGEAARVTGTVRTCSVISVPQTDIRERLGLSQYYQLMLFPDLDGARIVVRNKDGTKLDYRRFPITVCCTELPPGMSPADMERKPFIVDGYFYRFWKYQSEKTDQSESGGQVSPLIISKCPTLIASDIGRLNSLLLIFAVSIIAIILAMFVGYRIADRRRKTPAERILDTLPQKIDLSGLGD